MAIGAVKAMDVSSSTYGDTGVIRLSGRFDYLTHHKLRGAVDAIVPDPAIRSIHIDLGAVEHIDYSALGLLLVCRDSARKFGKSIALCNAGGDVKQTLFTVRLNKLFAIAWTSPQQLAAGSFAAAACFASPNTNETNELEST